MERRTYLKTMMAGAAIGAAPVMRGATGKPILLHVDLSVDPAKEGEMLDNFRKIFKPAASKQPGYVDVKMLKLRTALQGGAPEGVNYRFALTFESEELRQKWVASAIHRKVWPTIENTLKHKNYRVLLFDVE